MTDKYWVTGGNGHWNDSSNWSTLTGGPGGDPPPTATDSAFFNALSLGAPCTIDVTAASCLDFDCRGYTGNLIGSTVALNVYGAFYLASAMTYAFTAPINFLSTFVGRDLDCAGKGIANALTFAGVGGGWNIRADLNNVSSIVHSSGSFVSNGFTITCTSFTSSGSTRILDLSNATLNCTSWSAVATNLTFFPVNSTINITGSGTAFVTGGLAYNAVSLIPTADFIISGAGATIVNLNIANTSGYLNVTAPNISITTVFTITGFNNHAARLSFGSQSYFTKSTVTSTTLNSFVNVDFIGVQAAGGATWSGISIGDAGNNAGITFTTAKQVYWVQGVSVSQDFRTNPNFATTSGGSTSSANFPLPQDTCILDANSFAASGKTLTCSQNNFRFPGINFTGTTNSPTFSPANPSFYGNLLLVSGMTFSPTGTLSFLGLGNASITSAGKTFPAFSLSYMPGTTIGMNDNLTSSGAVTWNIGGFAANNFNLTCTAFNSTGGSVRTLTMGSGIWELTGSGAVWNFNGAFAGNVTIVPGTSTIKLTHNGALAKSVYGIGKTWGNFWNATAGAGVVAMQDSAKWKDFKIAAGRTQQFVAGTTTTVDTFTPLSSAGNVITISSVTSAQHFLVQANTNFAGRFISCDYLNISYSNASPAFNWYAGANSTDSGNNTGWIFTVPPTTGIKTINGIPVAQVKTINGIASNQVKSIVGIV